MVCRNPEAIEHEDPVAVIAYELYQRAGCPRGRDLEFWSLAEQQYTASRRLVDALVRSAETGAMDQFGNLLCKPMAFPTPSLRLMQERPELAAEILTRAVLLEECDADSGRSSVADHLRPALPEAGQPACRSGRHGAAQGVPEICQDGHRGGRGRGPSWGDPYLEIGGEA